MSTWLSVALLAALGAAMEMEVLPGGPAAAPAPESHESHERDSLFNAGQRLWLAGDGEEAFSLLSAAAAAGHAEAQHAVATAHGTGVLGAEPDEARSILFDHFAAMGGSAGASLTMGHRYLHGLGVPENCSTALTYLELAATAAVEGLDTTTMPPQRQERRSRVEELQAQSRDDDAELVHYFELAASMGSRDALVQLGELHFYGLRGLAPDPAEAARFFREAADQGSNRARAALGHMALHGVGLPQDDVAALHWFMAAADHGEPHALNGVGFMTLHGRGGVDAPDRAAAQGFLERAAQRGLPDALFNLGVLHATDPLDADFVQAHHYFSLAAQAGHLPALHRLATMTMHGLGTTASCAHAARLFRTVAENGRAAEADFRAASAAYLEGDEAAALQRYARLAHEGFEVAQSNAARLLLDRDTPEDERRAYRLYEQASRQGNVHACVFLGDFHFYGMGNSSVDYGAALEQYRRGAKLRSAQAAFNVAYMHHHGIGLPQDFHLAKRLYDQAVEFDARAWAPAAIALAHMMLAQVFGGSGPGVVAEGGGGGGLADDSLLILLLLVLLAGVAGVLARRRPPGVH